MPIMQLLFLKHFIALKEDEEDTLYLYYRALVLWTKWARLEEYWQLTNKLRTKLQQRKAP